MAIKSWFQDGETRFFPKLCFLERAKPKTDETLGAVTVVHVPSEASSWHEYAHGVVAEYFEELDEAKPDVRTGSYNNEDQSEA